MYCTIYPSQVNANTTIISQRYIQENDFVTQILQFAFKEIQGHVIYTI